MLINIQQTENLITSLDKTAVQGLVPPYPSIVDSLGPSPTCENTAQHTSPLITGGDGAATELTGSKLTPIMVGQLGYFSIICLWSRASLGSSLCIL